MMTNNIYKFLEATVKINLKSYNLLGYTYR